MTFKILKFTIITILPLILGGCILASKEETPFISSNEEAIIKSILTENGITLDDRLYDHLEVEYLEYPNHYDEESYKITLSDSSFDRIVLSDKINLLQGIDNFKGVIVKCENDSLEILTDSVVILPSIELWGLTKIPKEIGQLRTQKLKAIGSAINSIPLQLSDMLNEPQLYPYTMILFDVSIIEVQPLLKSWYLDTCINQDFPDSRGWYNF